jgi:hypothetical protein
LIPIGRLTGHQWLGGGREGKADEGCDGQECELHVEGLRCVGKDSLKELIGIEEWIDLKALLILNETSIVRGTFHVLYRLLVLQKM